MTLPSRAVNCIRDKFPQTVILGSTILPCNCTISFDNSNEINDHYELNPLKSDIVFTLWLRSL